MSNCCVLLSARQGSGVAKDKAQKLNVKQFPSASVSSLAAVIGVLKLSLIQHRRLICSCKESSGEVRH